MSGVEVGQVWADNDSRCAGRTLRIAAVVWPYANCIVLTNSDSTQDLIDRRTPLSGWMPKDKRGTTTRIRLDRFKATSTGYRLVGVEKPSDAADTG